MSEESQAILETRPEGPFIMEDVWVRVLILLICSSAFFAKDWVAERLVAGRQRFFGAAHEALDGRAQQLSTAVNQAVASKIRGRWTVDAKMADGADVANLTLALQGANDGDVIALRPGIYDQAVTISKSITIEGSGPSPEDVWITSQGPQTIEVIRGHVAFRNLTLSNAADESAWVANVGGGSLSLQKVHVRSPGYGIRVQDADLDTTDLMMDVKRGLTFDGRSESRLFRTQIVSKSSAILAAGSRVKLVMERTDVQSEEGSALEASRFAKVQISDGTLVKNARAAVLVNSGAEVRIARTGVSDNRGCGFLVDGGSVFLEQVNVENSQCGVGFAGPSTADIRKSVFAHLSLGPIAYKRGTGKEVTIRGSENVGLKIPEPKTAEKRARSR